MNRTSRCLICTGVLIALPVFAQFTSGSTGSDGPLDYTGKCPNNSVVFNPAAFTPPLDPAGDNVFNFTTITIPNNCEVKLLQSVLNGPVIWLATGAVTIGGGATLNLGGASGGPSFPTSLRVLATPGAGGYPGGAASGSSPAGPGFGPGGGIPCASGVQATGGKYTGNLFAIPLVGGSGGGGCNTGGGAGGGAILIASSTQIQNGGVINVPGGSGPCGGAAAGGSGGAVRLVAPSVSAGTINAYGGNNGCNGNNAGSAGAIRIESFNNPGGNFPGNNGSNPTVTYGSPFNTFVTASQVPTIKVVSVNGVPVTQPATGSFQMPDVTINTGSPVTLQIQASQVPVGTVAALLFFSDNGPDMTVNSTPLAGTLAASTATATVTFPAGYTRGFVSASFTPQ